MHGIRTQERVNPVDKRERARRGQRPIRARTSCRRAAPRDSYTSRACAQARRVPPSSPACRRAWPRTRRVSARPIRCPASVWMSRARFARRAALSNPPRARSSSASSARTAPRRGGTRSRWPGPGRSPRAPRPRRAGPAAGCSRPARSGPAAPACGHRTGGPARPPAGSAAGRRRDCPGFARAGPGPCAGTTRRAAPPSPVRTPAQCSPERQTGRRPSSCRIAPGLPSVIASPSRKPVARHRSAPRRP